MEFSKQWICSKCMSIASGPRCGECGADAEEVFIFPNSQALPPETILNGRYRLGRVLGQGGFGITYRALDLKLNRLVAIKEYFPSSFVKREYPGCARVVPNSERDAAFFRKGGEDIRREANLLNSFQDLMCIVKVYEGFMENSTEYIVMQLLEGMTIMDFTKSMGGRVPVDTVLNMMCPLMLDLQRIHGAKLIHRDISPTNIIVHPDNRVTLIDFGASRPMSQGNTKLTVLVHKGYAPAEQYDALSAQGAWTDIYALCATMYYAITGKEPDDSKARSMRDEVAKPSEMGIKIRPDIEQALMKGMAVEKSNRYQNIGELIQAFYIDKPPVKPPVKPPEKPRTVPVAKQAPQKPLSSPPRETWLIGLLGVLAKVFTVLMPPLGIAAGKNLKRMRESDDESEIRDLQNETVWYLLISVGLWAMIAFIIIDRTR